MPANRRHACDLRHSKNNTDGKGSRSRTQIDLTGVEPDNRALSRENAMPGETLDANRAIWCIGKLKLTVRAPIGRFRDRPFLLAPLPTKDGRPGACLSLIDNILSTTGNTTLAEKPNSSMFAIEGLRFTGLTTVSTTNRAKRSPDAGGLWFGPASLWSKRSPRGPSESREALPSWHTSALCLVVGRAVRRVAPRNCRNSATLLYKGINARDPGGSSDRPIIRLIAAQ
jgi:hypothetical protein